MVERGANIDIVFRNGLKDFEVLPPPEVWDNIQPAIKGKQKPVIILRAAALVAALLTISFFAYRLSREVPSDSENTVMALNDQSAFFSDSPLTDKPVADISEKSRPFIKPSISRTSAVEIIPDYVIESENETASSPDVALVGESDNYNLNTSRPDNGLSLATYKTSLKNIFKIEESDQQYIPEMNPINVTDRWSVSAMASPTYYSRFNSGKDALSKQMMSSEQPIISYSGGLAFSYKVNKRLSIQSGLYYSSLGQDLDGINSFGGFQKYDYTKGDRNFEVLTTSGTIYTNNPDVFLSANGMGDKVLTSFNIDVFDPEKASLQYINNTIRQTFSYLELPVVVRYKVIDKFIDVNLIGGISYNMLVQNSVYTVGASGKYPIGKTEGLNPISLSSSFGMGMEYSFSDKLSLNLEPTFRYYLNPFSETSGSQFHPYSFGIFSGISYKF